MNSDITKIQAAFEHIEKSIQAEVVLSADGVPAGLKINNPEVSSEDIIEAIIVMRQLGGIMDVFAKFAIGDLYNQAASRGQKYGNMQAIAEKLLGAGHYAHVRNIAYITRRFPIEKRVIVPHWYVYQDTAPDEISEDFRQRMLAEAAAGRLTVEKLRQRIKNHKEMQTAWTPRDEREEPTASPAKVQSVSEAVLGDGTIATEHPGESVVSEAFATAADIEDIQAGTAMLEIEVDATADAYVETLEVRNTARNITCSAEAYEQLEQYAEWISKEKKDEYDVRRVIEEQANNLFASMCAHMKFSGKKKAS